MQSTDIKTDGIRYNHITISLRLEDEIDGQDEEDETDQMVEAHRLRPEQHHREDSEHKQGYGLLDHLQLPQGERTAIIDKARPVSRNHKTVFDARHQPTQQDDHWQRQFREPGVGLQFQVPIPGTRHKDIRT